MLRLRPFTLLQPTSVDEAVGLLAEHGSAARLIAGGTDLLPNMKLLQSDPEVLVSLRDIGELKGIGHALSDGGEAVWIGAGTRLIDIADNAMLQARLPAVAHAASRIASPQIRNMGTLGGNLCLDTRCRYINQSELFREALGGCLKSHGSECHVVPGGQGCVAALSSDLAPALIAAGAVLDLAGPDGRRELAAYDLYCTDGLRHTTVRDGEVLLGARVPVPGPRTLLTYRKWAVRRAIDFPLVSIALRLELEPEADIVAGGLLVVGVLGPRPRRIKLKAFAGAAVDEALAESVGDVAFKRCRPLPNVPYDPAYRRARLRVEVRRAVRAFAQALAAGKEAR